MTEELKPCPAGHTTTYIVEDTQIGVNLTATAFYGECDCGWRGPYRYQSRDAAEEAWNARAESAEVAPMSPENREIAYGASATLHALGYAWDGKAWVCSAESAEQKQEPVAAMWINPDGSKDFTNVPEVADAMWTPLYTHPESAEVERLRILEDSVEYWRELSIVRDEDNVRLRARVEELEDKALRYDLDQAGIAMREKIDCELVDARARVAELEAAQTWRPIEGAPKDGTKILLCDGYDYCIARWEDLSGWYEVSYREGLIYSGLARWEGWMPLAPMPEES